MIAKQPAAKNCYIAEKQRIKPEFCFEFFCVVGFCKYRFEVFLTFAKLQ
jgi:hypothetical protein